MPMPGIPANPSKGMFVKFAKFTKILMKVETSCLFKQQISDKAELIDTRKSRLVLSAISISLKKKDKKKKGQNRTFLS